MRAAAALPPLPSLLPGQCVVLVTQRLFQFFPTTKARWIHGLHIRVVWPLDIPGLDIVNLIGIDEATVYMTEVSFQGDAAAVQTRAVDAWLSGQAYFESATFTRNILMIMLSASSTRAYISLDHLPAHLDGHTHFFGVFGMHVLSPLRARSSTFEQGGGFVCALLDTAALVVEWSAWNANLPFAAH